jgi:subtilisin family serine protease
MRKVVFSVFLMFLIFVFTGLSATNTSLVKPINKIKIAKKFKVLLDAAVYDNKFKTWIFFTDKGFSDNKSLKAKLKNIENRFTKRCLKRRINRTEKTDIFDFYDIPVHREYIRILESMGLEILRESRWLNAVSVYADYETINSISELLFVSEIKPVAKAVRKPPDSDNEIEKPIKSLKPSVDLPVSWYGSSYTQLDQINIPIMHYLEYTGAGVLIAIFDTGFDLYHPVFGSLNLIADSSFIDDTLVSQGHGTGTLSVVGGRADSALIGSAYGADFMVAATEVVSYENQTEEDNWVAAAEWAGGGMG